MRGFRCQRARLCHAVSVTSPWHADDRLRELVRELSTTPVQICLAPYVPNLEVPNRQFTKIANVPMLELFQQPISGWSYIVKELEDRIIAALKGPAVASIASEELGAPLDFGEGLVGVAISFFLGVLLGGLPRYPGRGS